MKIAFIGDSFCGGQSKTSWTNILSKRLGADVLCRGRGGMSIGHAYFDLIEHLLDADLYFMFYTDHNRLYNPQCYPLNQVSCDDYGRNGLDRMVSHNTTFWPDDDVWDAGLTYYRHLYHEPYHELVHGLIVDRCDEILSQHLPLHPYKRVYHFHSFPPKQGMKQFASGPCAKEAMIDMVNRHGKTVNPGDKDENHMSTEQNARFADAMYEIVNSNPTGWFDLP